MASALTCMYFEHHTSEGASTFWGFEIRPPFASVCVSWQLEMGTGAAKLAISKLNQRGIPRAGRHVNLKRVLRNKLSGHSKSSENIPRTF